MYIAQVGGGHFDDMVAFISLVLEDSVEVDLEVYLEVLPDTLFHF